MVIVSASGDCGESSGTCVFLHDVMSRVLNDAISDMCMIISRGMIRLLLILDK